MAAMLFALLRVRISCSSSSHEIWFAGFMGGESGQQGARTLSGKEKFDFAIVGEPTRLQTVNTHKGSVWLNLRARGRAAHGSPPQIGENAIEKILEVIGVLGDELSTRLGASSDETLGPLVPILGRPRRK